MRTRPSYLWEALSSQTPIKLPLVSFTVSEVIQLKLPELSLGRPWSSFASLKLQQVNGLVLPSWLSFDSRSARFSGSAPEGLTHLRLELIGRDFLGQEISLEIELHFNSHPRSFALNQQSSMMNAVVPDSSLKNNARLASLDTQLAHLSQLDPVVELLFQNLAAMLVQGKE
jgi:hypothetical protein